MTFMDLLFTEYASPFSLLDFVIPAGQFESFVDTFYSKHEERLRWEYYIHKLSPFDERTWEEFNNDIDFGASKQQEKPSDETIEETIKHSFDIMKNFKLERGD